MIIIKERDTKDFERLLEETLKDLHNQAQIREAYFLNRTGIKLEQDVFEILKRKARGTSFKKIELISGQRFPDIVAYVNEIQGLGLEVKTTTQNHWKTTGSSIFESTRVDNIESIYLLFGKLVHPIEFEFKKYEDCLYDVVVTHSPRYLIDMQLGKNDTIFKKINIPYSEFRELKNPFVPIKRYMREHSVKKGDDVWWIDNEDNIDRGVIRNWNNLTIDKRKKIQVEMMMLFPEVYGKSNNKYQQIASWLVAKHGIVHPNLRDTFSSSGQMDINIKRRMYRVPKIFYHLNTNIEDLLTLIGKYETDELEYYWNVKGLLKKDKVEVWQELVQERSKDVLANNSFRVEMLWDKK